MRARFSLALVSRLTPHSILACRQCAQGTSRLQRIFFPSVPECKGWLVHSLGEYLACATCITLLRWGEKLANVLAWGKSSGLAARGTVGGGAVLPVASAKGDSILGFSTGKWRFNRAHFPGRRDPGAKDEVGCLTFCGPVTWAWHLRVPRVARPALRHAGQRDNSTPAPYSDQKDLPAWRQVGRWGF